MIQNQQEQCTIPSPSTLKNPTLSGTLKKQLPRSWWRLCNTWKNRLCILQDTKIFYYESELSKGCDKTSGVINLDHFDICEEVVKDSKNSANVFVIYSSAHSVIDSREEMNKWIESVRKAIRQAKRKSGSTKRKSERNSLKEETDKEDPDLNLDELAVDETLMNATKGRPKGPKGRRPPIRKSMQPQSSVEKVNGKDSRRRANSMGAFPENIPEEDEENDTSASSESRKSRSLHSLNQDNDGNEEEAKRLENTDENEQINTQSALKDAPSKLIYKQKQISPLIQELQQRYVLPQNKNRSISENDRDSVTQEEITVDSKRGINKNVKDMNSMLGDLKSNITEIEIDIHSVRTEIKKIHEKLNETREDQFEEKINEKMKKLEELQSNAMSAINDANKAKEEYNSLINECRLLIQELKTTNNSTEEKSEENVTRSELVDIASTE
ncbi:Pleckstrin domain-containing family O member 1-like protein [Dinothrombium tinctorium]|uniref:Pleckstrin domain-containing family O member 1-like protein n=1 Tax=Dinothrombium tinctorium TaxID=1965070 RepID=A0A443RPK1_9ACAR|nr:Pleckstrin domain-containing family O member 1-like protein [Dinothrombium tinctorium]